MSQTVVSDALFCRIHEEFADRGLLGQALRLEEDGKTYSVRCDDECFTIYRVNDQKHIPPALPGWMVCRLSSRECFSMPEHSTDSDDHLKNASQWMNMILSLLNSANQKEG